MTYEPHSHVSALEAGVRDHALADALFGGDPLPGSPPVPSAWSTQVGRGEEPLGISSVATLISFHH